MAPNPAPSGTGFAVKIDPDKYVNASNAAVAFDESCRVGNWDIAEARRTAYMGTHPSGYGPTVVDISGRTDGTQPEQRRPDTRTEAQKHAVGQTAPFDGRTVAQRTQDEQHGPDARTDAQRAVGQSRNLDDRTDAQRQADVRPAPVPDNRTPEQRRAAEAIEPGRAVNAPDNRTDAQRRADAQAHPANPAAPDQRADAQRRADGQPVTDNRTEAQKRADARK